MTGRAMETGMMDARTKTVIASFMALFGILALAAWASLNQAQPNAALTRAVFGQTE